MNPGDFSYSQFPAPQGCIPLPQFHGAFVKVNSDEEGAVVEGDPQWVDGRILWAVYRMESDEIFIWVAVEGEKIFAGSLDECIWLQAAPDSTGDTKVEWDPSNTDEVSAARAQFDALRKKSFLAYKVKRDGTRAEQIHAFDPQAERIILSPPLAGG